MSIGYAKSQYGSQKRIFQVPWTKVDIATASGAIDEVFITVPTKSQLVKFGFLSAASDIICSTTTTFRLETYAGTLLATFVPGDTTIGSGVATAAAPDTATNLKRARRYRVSVGEGGSSGSVYFFVDVRDKYETTI